MPASSLLVSESLWVHVYKFVFYCRKLWSTVKDALYTLVASKEMLCCAYVFLYMCVCTVWRWLKLCWLFFQRTCMLKVDTRAWSAQISDSLLAPWPAGVDSSEGTVSCFVTPSYLLTLSCSFSKEQKAASPCAPKEMRHSVTAPALTAPTTPLGTAFLHLSALAILSFHLSSLPHVPSWLPS